MKFSEFRKFREIFFSKWFFFSDELEFFLDHMGDAKFCVLSIARGFRAICSLHDKLWKVPIMFLILLSKKIEIFFKNFKISSKIWKTILSVFLEKYIFSKKSKNQKIFFQNDLTFFSDELEKYLWLYGTCQILRTFDCAWFRSVSGTTNDRFDEIKKVYQLLEVFGRTGS